MGNRIGRELVQVVFSEIGEAVDVPLLHVRHHIGVLEILRHVLHLILLLVFEAVPEVFVLRLLLAIPQILLEYEIDDHDFLVPQVLSPPLLDGGVFSLPAMLVFVQGRVHLHGAGRYVGSHVRGLLVVDDVFVIDFPQLLVPLVLLMDDRGVEAIDVLWMFLEQVDFSSVHSAQTVADVVKVYVLYSGILRCLAVSSLWSLKRRRCKIADLFESMEALRIVLKTARSRGVGLVDVILSR